MPIPAVLAPCSGWCLPALLGAGCIGHPSAPVRGPRRLRRRVVPRPSEGPALPPGGSVLDLWGRRWTESIDRPARLDLVARADDVRRISRRLPLWRVLVHVLGWEEGDLDQEVMLRLHIRQTSRRSAYDPSRAGLPSYLWMACSSILSHLRQAAERQPRGGRGGRRAWEEAWPEGRDFAEEVEIDLDEEIDP